MHYDYIIVGAGSAGCIVAARLTEDPTIKVLLVEAGGSDRGLVVAMPAALPFAYQSKKLGWGYQSGPEPHLGGRIIDEKRGRVIGGSSSINAMLFNRGNPLDFDSWADAGLREWGYAHCLPYFRRMETFQEGADDWRGGEGPMQISRCNASHKLHDVFLRSGEQAGYSVTSDHNGFKQEGLHIAQAFIHKGSRWTPADGYLRPALSRGNLEVLSNASVQRVVIENGAAIGIEVIDGKGSRQIVCNREVILCAGAFNSPQLLMLSGVGDPDHLRELGITLKAEARQVGRNLENHPGVNLQYSTNYEDSLVSELNLLGQAKLGADWLLRKKGLGTSNFFETGAFLKTREDVTYPNMQFEFLPLTRQLKIGKLVAIPGFQFWMDLSRPESRGRVQLRSANPSDAPSIVFNHLSTKQDIKDIIDGIRIAREMIRQPIFDRFRGIELAPGPDVNTDSELEAFIRANVGTSFHPAGTCRMGTDAEAVVDSEGRVNAVRRMRVIDGSIMPKIVTANLSASIMMMAEKISDRILNKTPLPASTASFYQSAN
ncbi:choline dehydrogenase [Agrobacterium tumefaciens str. Cherry 2E-2-2]|uniref:Choline dehydrogenase n=1 Tax=Agrobacterium deltaense Zutra 3/1 TaxID=1183427 RepID=A0A1S7R8N0_9HYPH|nr:choline dehydrogenase [Agrobacterium deltaense]EMS96311.1 choline dehydrogenase [Agrobacterium tumefaciens str. Cherry 2E-2-2]CUX48561.1 Choline dehydrogenase [Agrobacterium deltaense Zutra 3/1]